MYNFSRNKNTPRSEFLPYKCDFLEAIKSKYKFRYSSIGVLTLQKLLIVRVCLKVSFDTPHLEFLHYKMLNVDISQVVLCLDTPHLEFSSYILLRMEEFLFYFSVSILLIWSFHPTYGINQEVASWATKFRYSSFGVFTLQIKIVWNYWNSFKIWFRYSSFGVLTLQASSGMYRYHCPNVSILLIWSFDPTS